MSHQDNLPELEVSLNEINQLITAMEKGSLSLDQSLHHFERGVTLIKHCQKIISDAEQKVQLLLQQNGQTELQNYEELQHSPLPPSE